MQKSVSIVAPKGFFHSSFVSQYICILNVVMGSCFPPGSTAKDRSDTVDTVDTVTIPAFTLQQLGLSCWVGCVFSEHSLEASPRNDPWSPWGLNCTTVKLKRNNQKVYILQYIHCTLMRCWRENIKKKYTGLKMDFKSNHVSFAFQKFITRKCCFGDDRPFSHGPWLLLKPVDCLIRLMVQKSGEKPPFGCISVL